MYAGIIDTSGWQFLGYKNGTIPPGSPIPDLGEAKALGVEAVIHRVGNGGTFDQSFPLVRQAAANATLPFGAYYYIQPARYGPQDSADRCLQWLDEYPINFKFMVDAEHFNGQDNMSRPEVSSWIRLFAEAMEAGMEHRPIIYTGKWWWNVEVGGDLLAYYDSILARYPAQNYSKPTSQWQAVPPEVAFWDDFAFKYGPTGPPLPAGETHWDGWQFTSWLKAGDFGFQDGPRLDGNIIKRASFDRWLIESGWGVTEPPTVPPVIPPEPPTTTPGRVSVNANMPVLKINTEMDTRHVSSLQEMLNKFKSGVTRIAVDGQFGPQTEGAVEDVQRVFGMTVDGWVGSQTWPVVLEYPWT